MTIVAARHLKSDGLEFIVLCTDSRGVVTGQPPVQMQKIYRAGDFLVTGTGSSNLIKMAADYADSVRLIPPGIDKVVPDVVRALNSYLREEISPEQLEEQKTNILIAGPERTDGGVNTGLALFCIYWQEMLTGQVPFIPRDYVIEGSGKFAVWEDQQSGKSWAPTKVQDIEGALLDVYYKAIVAGRDPGVDGDLQFAIQVFRWGNFRNHILLPPTLIGKHPLLPDEDYVKLFLGRRYSDRTIVTLDNFRTESTWAHAFYDMLVNQLASIILKRQKLKSSAETGEDLVQYETVRKELSGTLSALVSRDFPLIREAVKAGAAYVDRRLRESIL